MKKIIIVAFIIASFLISCKKENSVCWECVHTATTGPTLPAKYMCNSGEQPSGFTDSEGNPATYSCTKQ
jgi:hypothetical protein